MRLQSFLALSYGDDSVTVMTPKAILNSENKILLMEVEKIIRTFSENIDKEELIDVNVFHIVTGKTKGVDRGKRVKKFLSEVLQLLGRDDVEVEVKEASDEKITITLREVTDVETISEFSFRRKIA